MEKLSVDQIRNRYLRFFGERGHAVLPSASLVPENDPTTLFTSSGMQPLVPYLLGEKHSKGTRLVNSQKSFRAEDIDEVGDNRHTTFFEMLGNWSLGDYFKKEQIPWSFEFLTKDISLPKDRLSVTCFEGDPTFGLPRDEESAKIWESLGIPKERIHFYGTKKNWWSRSGTPDNMPMGEPGGPDSEIFYEFTHVPHDKKFGEHCHPNCDCGRFMEIGNSVFMEYKKTANGFKKLPKQNVDFGGGLERIAAAINDNPDIFLIDTFVPLVEVLRGVTGVLYDGNDRVRKKNIRVAADHVRASTFLISDAVLPSNKERGYILRRLMRRAVFKLNQLGAKDGRWIAPAVAAVASSYRSFYPDIEAKREEITEIIGSEFDKFQKTIEGGTRVFQKIVDSAPGNISGRDAFDLFGTFGFPLELTVELAAERNLTVDVDGFRKEFENHQNLSRGGSEKKFKGGLADTSAATVRLHTAHHLLLGALQEVLGKNVKQRGSNITAERLRLDFSHPAKMTADEIQRVESIVNEKISEALPIVRTVMPKVEAERLRAESEFGQTYPDEVSVYSIGPTGASEADPKFDSAFSIEFCGGPHVKKTSELSGKFKILKEEAVSAGVRRIKAVLG